MSGHPKRPRVLLATLSVRTSGKGNPYLAGWLGKAKVVGFAGRAAGTSSSTRGEASTSRTRA